MPPSPQHVPNPQMVSKQWYNGPTGLKTDPWAQNQPDQYGIGNLSAQLEAHSLNDGQSIPSSAGQCAVRGSGPIFADVRSPPSSYAPTTLTRSDQSPSIPLDEIRFRDPPSKIPLGPSGREHQNLIDFPNDPSTMSAPRNDGPVNEFEIKNWKDSSRTSSMSSGSVVTSTKNPINELQEYVVSNKMKHPLYIEDRGMDGLFSVKCVVEGNCLE